MIVYFNFQFSLSDTNYFTDKLVLTVIKNTLLDLKKSFIKSLLQ